MKEQASEAGQRGVCAEPLGTGARADTAQGHGGFQPQGEPAGREGTNLPGHKRGTESHTKEAHRDPATGTPASCGRAEPARPDVWWIPAGTASPGSRPGLLLWPPLLWPLRLQRGCPLVPPLHRAMRSPGSPRLCPLLALLFHK